MKWNVNVNPILFLLLSLMALSSCCEEESISYCWVKTEMGEFEWMEVDEMPDFLDGGQDGFHNSIGGEIKYPAEARENDIEGTVTATYEITTQGTVKNILITEDIGFGCGEEVRRTLQSITAGISYDPAKIDGIPQHVRKELPIKFELQ